MAYPIPLRGEDVEKYLLYVKEITDGDRDEGNRLQSTDYLVTTLTGHESDDTLYASCKAIANYINTTIYNMNINAITTVSANVTGNLHVTGNEYVYGNGIIFSYTDNGNNSTSVFKLKQRELNGNLTLSSETLS